MLLSRKLGTGLPAVTFDLGWNGHCEKVSRYNGACIVVLILFSLDFPSGRDLVLKELQCPAALDLGRKCLMSIWWWYRRVWNDSEEEIENHKTLKKTQGNYGSRLSCSRHTLSRAPLRGIWLSKNGTRLLPLPQLWYGTARHKVICQTRRTCTWVTAYTITRTFIRKFG